ncbi:acetoacetate decarboxylase [Cucurbitaria berberidis CBS 394.84]|uniref:Acetoacetate decarboxylase n=1 Tax=Cucurbitaria berberidis CBS 394.84 TaxID=1168544 RepID=A0A9P4L678_9PLEO|nr:acetoacetate decarboxylase [Cucurbitaria berberidis CBS 394.84]KAF1843082.1 acetoacetate decarboxylase [Cucurbitaria berberidis CBS 394.84]
MAPGSLSVSNNPIPAFAPPYTTETNDFADVSLLIVTYRTSLEDVRSLVPEFLELEEEPLVTAMIVTYEMSTVGAYNEYVHQVEVVYDGKKYDYFLSLILNNEAAIFSGREQFGFPKTFGKVTLERNTGTGLLLGQVEKPEGLAVANFGFAPLKKLSEMPKPDTPKQGLNLRIIPSPIAGAPASLKELIPSNFEVTGGSVWLGRGSISFPNTMEHHPLYRVRVLRYENSVYIHKASGILHAPTAIFTVKD